MRLVTWTSRAVLIAYGIIVLSGYWSMLVEPETTAKLVGGEAGCSHSLVDCGWVAFAIEKAVGLAILGTATATQLVARWRRKHGVLLAITLLAIAHLIVLRLLSTQS